MRNFSIPINFSSIEDTNDEFLKVTLMVISEGVNLNKSYFTLNGMKRNKDSFINKPILCSFPNGDIGGAHDFDIKFDPENMTEYQTFLSNNSERPVGLIPESSNIRIEEIDGKEWIVLEGFIWKKYNYELVKDIKRKSNTGWAIRNNKRISAEIYINDNEAKYMEDGETEILENWCGSGITILGDNVQEAIVNANLREFNASPEYKNYTRMFMSKFTEFMERSQWGSGDSIEIDKSKDSASNDDWGSIDKTKLRNDILKAKNYKALVKSVYALVESGWEDAPSEKLKYPIMQIKGNKVVYNIGALSSALGYAKAEGVTSVISKVESIRKKMGVDKDKKSTERKMSMELKKYFENKTDKYLFISEISNKYALVFSKADHTFKAIPFETSDDNTIVMAEEDTKECSLLAKIDEEDENGEIADSDKKEEDLASCNKELSSVFEKMCNSCEEKKMSEHKEDEDEDEEIADEDKKEEDLSQEKAEFEDLKLKYAEKCEELSEAKKEISKFAEKELSEEKACMAKELDEYAEKECMSEEEVKLAKKDIENFSSKEDFMKSVMFNHYIKIKEQKKTDRIFMDMNNANDVKKKTDVFSSMKSKIK